jgi:CubicO group peptidase (beta-lactamase class C family)
MGFMKSSATWPFGSPAAYGAPGAGGSLGFADPQAGIGYANVTNRMRMKVTGDPREVALRNAVSSCLGGSA